LINSGAAKESTGEMVKMVSKGKFEREFELMDEITKEWNPEFIKENERLLEAIGVVGEKAKRMIKIVEGEGGMAKVCGAGGVKEGSGMLLAFDKQVDRLTALIKKQKWEGWLVSLGAEGVRYE